jgi:hypothetical protein
MQFYPLWRGPNSLMMNRWAITVVLTIQVIELMVIMLPTAISLFHGEVSCCVVLISRQSSSLENLPSVKSPLGPSVTFISLFSSYSVFYTSSR